MKIKATDASKAKRILNRFSDIVRLLLYTLIVLLLLVFFIGIIKMFFDLRLFLNRDLEFSIREIVIHTLILLALVEVIRTILSYLNDGVLKVTFIVDTVLIVMLNEIISLWFQNGGIPSIATLLGIITVLIIIRILTIKFSPGVKMKA